METCDWDNLVKEQHNYDKQKAKKSFLEAYAKWVNLQDVIDVSRLFMFGMIALEVFREMVKEKLVHTELMECVDGEQCWIDSCVSALTYIDHIDCSLYEDVKNAMYRVILYTVFEMEKPPNDETVSVMMLWRTIATDLMS